VLSASENLFSHTFSQNIWRILPHPSPDCDEWAIELRDPAQKTVAWTLLDLAAGRQRWHTTPEATDWWTTLTAFSGNRVCLHNYRYPDVPEPTDLLALSATDGALAWALPGWVYVREAEVPGTLVVARKQPESIEYRFCTVEAGLVGAPASEVGEPAATGIREPVRYMPRDVYFDVVSSFLGKIAGVPGPIAIDYLESNPYIVFSYYLYEQEKVAQYLLVVNRQREVICHERLSENRQGIGRNTLIWKAGRLVCLRHHNELVSLKLTH
jgi:hypothetical protein